MSQLSGVGERSFTLSDIEDFWNSEDEARTPDEIKSFCEKKKNRAAEKAGKLTKLEYFSLHLLQGMLNNERSWNGHDAQWNIMARDAIAAAEALIEELSDG